MPHDNETGAVGGAKEHARGSLAWKLVCRIRRRGMKMGSTWISTFRHPLFREPTPKQASDYALGEKGTIFHVQYRSSSSANRQNSRLSLHGPLPRQSIHFTTGLDYRLCICTSNRVLRARRIPLCLRVVCVMKSGRHKRRLGEPTQTPTSFVFSWFFSSLAVPQKD